MKTLQKLFTFLAIILFAIISLLPGKSFAADNNLTITVTGKVAGKTLSVYKLFDLTVAGTSDKPIYNYTWAGATQNFFTQKGYDTVEKATDYLKALEDDSTQLTKVVEEYCQYCKTNNISAIETKQVGATETEAIFNVTDQGYYLVYDETTSFVSMLSNVTTNTEIALKTDTPTVEKKADKATAAVGETVNYTVTSKVPNVKGYNSYKFIVMDTLSKGLTLINNVEVTIDGKKCTENTDYTQTIVDNSDNGTTNLTITFDPIKFAQLTAKIGKEIKITYSALLNENAATILDNTNEVIIKYSNNPTITDETDTTNPDVVHVYTYKIDFTKKNIAGITLPGAEFVLKLADGTFAIFDNNGIFKGTVEAQEEATVLVSDENGKIAISGLKAGTYTLIETKAPQGYSIPKFEFKFTISQKLNEDGTLETASFKYVTGENNTVAKGYMTDGSSSSASFKVDVLNAKEGALPSTGGIGTTIFTIVGVAIMIVAVVALIVYNKKIINNKNLNIL